MNLSELGKTNAADSEERDHEHQHQHLRAERAVSIRHPPGRRAERSIAEQERARDDGGGRREEGRADLDDDLLEEGSVGIAHEATQVAALLHAAAPVAARLAHVLLRDVAAVAAVALLRAAHHAAEAVHPARLPPLLVPHQRAHEDRALEQEVEHDPDRGVHAEVAQRRERGRGAEREREHVRQRRHRDRAPRVAHHQRDARRDVEVLGRAVERADQHKHVVHANADQDERQQARDGRDGHAAVASETVGAEDGKADAESTAQNHDVSTAKTEHARGQREQRTRRRQRRRRQRARGQGGICRERGPRRGRCTRSQCSGRQCHRR
eukprot:2310245-Rhodomonas_salina.10